MRIDQLELQLEDKSAQVRVWNDLPQDNQMHVARIYARLCLRAARVVASMSEQKEGTEP